MLWEFQVLMDLTRISFVGGCGFSKKSYSILYFLYVFCLKSCVRLCILLYKEWSGIQAVNEEPTRRDQLEEASRLTLPFEELRRDRLAITLVWHWV